MQVRSVVVGLCHINLLPKLLGSSCKSEKLRLRYYFHINAVRMLVVKHLMWRQQFSWNCSTAMLQYAYLLYLSFSLECFERLFLPVNHFSSTSALASRGQSCPRHVLLGCHDHYCLLHMRLWALAWATGPVQKVGAYHWAQWPHNSNTNLTKPRVILYRESNIMVHVWNLTHKKEYFLIEF